MRAKRETHFLVWWRYGFSKRYENAAMTPVRGKAIVSQDKSEGNLAKWSDICEQAAEQGAFIGRCREYANARERRN